MESVSSSLGMLTVQRHSRRFFRLLSSGDKSHAFYSGEREARGERQGRNVPASSKHRSVCLSRITALSRISSDCTIVHRHLARWDWEARLQCGLAGVVRPSCVCIVGSRCMMCNTLTTSKSGMTSQKTIASTLAALRCRLCDIHRTISRDAVKQYQIPSILKPLPSLSARSTTSEVCERTLMAFRVSRSRWGSIWAGNRESHQKHPDVMIG